MRRLISALICLSFSMILLFCGCTMKTPCSYEGCTENTENGEKYCFTHSCLFCDNAIKDGTHYCTEHICKYKDSWGACKDGIIGKQDGDLYCEKHKDLDFDEFQKAKQVASEYNAMVSKKYDKLFRLFTFTDDFLVDENGYKFEVYNNDTYRYGYIIIVKNSNGELTCDGMRYN